MKIYQHGELMLVEVKKRLKSKGEAKTLFIAAHSETGHHHVLKSKVPFDVYIDGAETYIKVTKPAQLVHEKSFDMHRTLTIQPATYQVIHKTEYDPFSKIKKEVRD